MNTSINAITTVTSTSTAPVPSRAILAMDIILLSAGTDDTLGMRNRDRRGLQAEETEEPERRVAKTRRRGHDIDHGAAAIGAQSRRAGLIVDPPAVQPDGRGRPPLHPGGAAADRARGREIPGARLLDR